jgi:hypothetical protein
MAYYPRATSFEAVYRLTGPDGAVAVFNDPTDANYVGALTEVTGLDSADIRESASDLTESDGGAHGAFYLGRRPIVLNCRVFGHASVSERDIRIDRARRASLALRGDATLSWKPATRGENLVANPRGVTDTAGWSATATGVSSGGTMTRQTGLSTLAVGTTGLQVVTGGTGNANQGIGYSASVIAGKTYAVSVAARRTVGTANGEVFIAGVNTATINSTVSSTSFVVYTTTFTAAATGTVVIGIRQPTSNTTTGTYQISDVMLAPGVDPTYKDGDTAGWFWQGDSGVSASGDFVEQFTTVRRQQPFRESGAWVKDLQIPLVSEFATIFSTALKSSAMGVAAENRGNYPAYPLVNITGASTNPTVSDGTRTFKTTGLTLAAGETVQFDMLYHTGVFTNNAGGRINNSANRYIDFATTQWPYLTGNGTTQTFALTGGGSATIQYRDSWA